MKQTVGASIHIEIDSGNTTSMEVVRRMNGVRLTNITETIITQEVVDAIAK